jgi:pimeloyl-ACP methyl ester carboxylesterase
MTAEPRSLDSNLLPPGIRSRFIENVNGLRMHVLEAGHENAGRPCLLLLHGFPELGFSWRHLMLPLAAAGFHVVAPDQRGYGRTTGWDAGPNGELRSFSILNIVRDTLALVSALGHRSVAAVVGHDFGSPVAAWCALIRPDVFHAVALMSAPFAGPPSFPSSASDIPDASSASHASPASPASPATSGSGKQTPAVVDIHEALGALDPPRRHYQWYYSTPHANEDMWRCPQGVHGFLRAYYHVKSADWQDNRPFPLASWTAPELAKLPRYYVMDQSADMATTVAPHMPSAEAIAACRWLPDEALGVYAAEYERTGFQGGLQWYRCATSAWQAEELRLFAGRTIDVPSCFIAGASDWGIRQVPGALEAMQQSACTHFLACHLIQGAGHWVQQEQPEETTRLLLDFLGTARPLSGYQGEQAKERLD